AEWCREEEMQVKSREDEQQAGASMLVNL
ncbi:hypothetical protein Tco_0736303, partial [Tanacetum coccineum]